jgi:hypothetical protein
MAQFPGRTEKIPSPISRLLFASQKIFAFRYLIPFARFFFLPGTFSLTLLFLPRSFTVAFFLLLINTASVLLLRYYCFGYYCFGIAAAVFAASVLLLRVLLLRYCCFGITASVLLLRYYCFGIAASAFAASVLLLRYYCFGFCCTCISASI